MTPEQVLAAVNSVPSPVAFVESQLLSRTPWIFENDSAAFTKWRAEMAAQLVCASEDIYLVGSAATGYSLSPLKAGRAFRPVTASERYPSDIDIAVVYPALFVEAWDLIVSMDRRRLLARSLGSALARTGVSDGLAKMRFDLYHGTIGDVFAPPGSPVAARLRSLFAATTRREPFIGHRARARIYRRRQDLVDYHAQSIRRLQSSLQLPSRVP